MKLRAIRQQTEAKKEELKFEPIKIVTTMPIVNRQCQVAKCFYNQGTMQCSRCKWAWYCSHECRETDWAVHKQYCKPRTLEWIDGLQLVNRTVRNVQDLLAGGAEDLSRPVQIQNGAFRMEAEPRLWSFLCIASTAGKPQNDIDCWTSMAVHYGIRDEAVGRYIRECGSRFWLSREDALRKCLTTNFANLSSFDEVVVHLTSASASQNDPGPFFATLLDRGANLNRHAPVIGSVFWDSVFPRPEKYPKQTESVLLMHWLFPNLDKLPSKDGPLQNEERAARSIMETIVAYERYIWTRLNDSGLVFLLLPLRKIVFQYSQIDFGL